MQLGHTSGRTPPSRGRLICALGADEHAERLVRAARRLATVAGLHPLFVHVAEPWPGAVWQARSLLRHAGAHSAEMRVAVGDPSEAIIRCVREERASLVMVAARGFGPLKGALLGSVSRTLMLTSPVPVMVLPPAAEPAFDRVPFDDAAGLEWTAVPELLVVPRPEPSGELLEDELSIHVANRGTIPVLVTPTSPDHGNRVA